MEKKETVKDVLIRLAKENTSSAQDGKMVQSLLVNTLSYHACFITSGIVYLDGVGTMANPPMSIHGVAKMICRVLQIDLNN